LPRCLILSCDVEPNIDRRGDDLLSDILTESPWSFFIGNSPDPAHATGGRKCLEIARSEKG